MDFRAGTEASISLLMMPNKYSLDDLMAADDEDIDELRLPSHKQLLVHMRENSQKDLKEANKRYERKCAKPRHVLTFSDQPKRRGLVDKLRNQFR
jgi:hypothetical protein